MDIRDISSLPLSAELHDLLAKGGFRIVSDLQSISPIELAKEIDTSLSVALSIIQTVQSTHNSELALDERFAIRQLPAVTAKDIIAKIGTSNRALITFCKAIDDMLGGGIQVGQITEFCGVPGIGKTQLAIQLSLNVQIPEIFGGLGGECVFIDTGDYYMSIQLPFTLINPLLLTLDLLCVVVPFITVRRGELHRRTSRGDGLRVIEPSQ